MTRSNIKGIQCALYGLILRGPIADLLAIFSLDFLESVINVIAIGLFVAGLYVMLKMEMKFIVCSTIFFAALWLSSDLIYPENSVYIRDNLAQFFIYVLPFLWIGYFFIKKGLFLELFLPVARVKLILALIVQILIFIYPSKDIFEGDYQTAAYSIVGGLISVYYLSIIDKKILNISLSIFGTIVLFLCGSRSTFVAIIFFWLIYFIKHTSKSAQIGLVLITLFIFFFVGVQQFVAPLAQMAESMGFSTHLVEALQDNSIFEDSARESLYTGFIALIWLRPWGYGIMGDRFISFSTGLFWKPIYPHNIFLEIMVDFGYIIGAVLSILLIFFVFKAIFSKISYRYSMTVLVLTSISLIKLQFSGTFWDDQFFFMLLGTLLAQKYIKKQWHNVI